MNKRKIFILALSVSFLINSGSAFCQSQQTQSPQPLKGTAKDSKTEYVNKDWWDKFQDPVLKGYILKAVKDNYDLKVATLKVEEANAIVQEYFGKEFPGANLGLNYSRNRYSGNTSSSPASAYTNSAYIFPLTASYELDLWRKNRNITLSVEKALDAAKYEEKAAYISLCSTIATVYFNLVSTDRQIDVQKDIITLRKSILDMTKENNKYGLAPTTDVILADRALTDGMSELKDLQKRQALLSNQLAVLTGDSSDNSASLKRAAIDDIEFIKDLPKTVKSEIVQKRPDILKTEALLQKAKIDVTIARKDFLPSFPITGQLGFNSRNMSRAFAGDSAIASFGVGILDSVFAAGQKKARLKAKKSQYQQMMENYQNTILKAFQEVNDSLASLKFDSEKNNDNISRLKLERDNMGMINDKYALGAISLLDTLQYKERVYVLEKDQVKSKTDCLIDSLSLYKAVAGEF